MAHLFLDQLHCDNALYLDGVVSQYLVPELGIHYNKEAKIGPIISVSIK